MTEAYVGETRRGVTVLEVLPMHVAYQKTLEKDGYAATQVALKSDKKKISKALVGHLKKAKLSSPTLRELDFVEGVELGSELTADKLTLPGTTVDVSGISKGKGLAGVVKRHHFAGGPRTHGQSDRLRRAGSIGQGTTPGRVYKGKKMSGRMGNDSVTVKNLTVLSYDPSTSKLIVAGAVPGHVGRLVKVALVKEAPASYPSITLTKSNVVVTTPSEEVSVESETV